MVEVRNIYKSYGLTRALRGVSFTVPHGNFMVLVGPNGSGKTTLLKVLSGLTRSEHGSVAIDGRDIRNDSSQVRRRTGVVLHQNMLYGELTARGNLNFYAQMYGLRNPDERILQVVAQMGMTAHIDQRVSSMSHGMAKRISIARALLHNPDVLLLDEPETGLDEEGIEILKNIVIGKNEAGIRKTVLMSTHNISQWLEISDRVLVMAAGRVVHDGPSSMLSAASLRKVYQELVEVER
ncbi:MAG: heme ABC exporter ATP-binding protein CcmA [Dehalococcoidia bacterium]|nr:heme ABC exporter ATP-binding protein CcmA [Dehalococcoidia bacterium]